VAESPGHFPQIARDETNLGLIGEKNEGAGRKKLIWENLCSNILKE
jgi:hypothetical protein